MEGLREELREAGERELRALEGGGEASLKASVTLHGTRGPVRQVRMAPRVISLGCSGLLPEVHQSWFACSKTARCGPPGRRLLPLPRMEGLAPLGTDRYHGFLHGLERWE